MIALPESLLWIITRSTAFVAVVLLTSVVVLGAVTVARRRAQTPGDAVLSGLHRTLSMLAAAFILAHVLTSVADSYVDISWAAMLVPFTSSYRPLAIGLGTVAFDLLVAVLITGLLRQRISARVFRAVHWAVYAMWPIGLGHAVLASSVDTTAVVVVVVGCAVTGLAAVAWRLARPDPDAQARAVALAGSTERSWA